MTIPPKARPWGNPSNLKKPGIGIGHAVDAEAARMRMARMLLRAVRQTEAPIRPTSTGVQTLKGR